jgi:uncharacterized protein YbbC (DUF1343 family)
MTTTTTQRPQPFRPGIDVLLSRHKRWLTGKRVGLITHLAAVDSRGCTTAQRLRDSKAFDLVCLMGPEHGYFGRAGAGADCRSRRHPDWKIPIHSLYGTRRKPSTRVLSDLDILAIDLQDLGFRPYTYVSTLNLALQAAADAGIPVIIADRPVPLPRIVDGPPLDPAFASFVSAITAPMAYGMTPGETALWLQATCIPNVDIRVARMQGYARDLDRGADWPPFVRPSPSIVSWESAMCFPATVCFEGLPSVDHGRATDMPFQLIGAPWTRGPELCAALAEHNLPGVAFYPQRYESKRPDYAPGKMLSGIRMVVTHPARFRPILTGITIVHTLQELYGVRKVWNPNSSRPDFFDKLLGTDSVRTSLLSGASPAEISGEWKTPLTAFRSVRRKHLLYEASIP